MGDLGDARVACLEQVPGLSYPVAVEVGMGGQVHLLPKTARQVPLAHCGGGGQVCDRERLGIVGVNVGDYAAHDLLCFADRACALSQHGLDV